MSVASEEQRAARRKAQRAPLIDCDVHHVPARREDLLPYIPARFHTRYEQQPLPRRGGVVVGARPAPHIYRLDTVPEAGGTPGSDLELMCEQMLDPFNVEKAILNPTEVLFWPLHGEFAHALTAGLNDWTLAEWLDRDPRLFATIAIPQEDSARSVEEIERMAADPRFLGVLFTVVTREPLGHPKYWPIYEASVDRGLPIVVHVGGFGGAPETGAGWPNYFFEHHVAWTQSYVAQVVSMLSSGVFERFPGLQVVLEEGGFAWAPPLLWRLDRAWETMRAELPQLERRPSDVFREHFWFTTQPIDEPERPGDLVKVIDQMQMRGRVMFSSDYPHWDFDDPDRALPPGMPADLREQIFRTNAESLFRFAPAGE
jgi:predicted TIM-barrel fold metal-dependent hydrolase